MSQEFAEAYWTSVVENVGGYLLELGLQDDGAVSFASCFSGGLIHFRVIDSKGAVAMQVCGKDPDEVGAQVALACLHRISIDRLRALHKQTVRKPLELCKPK